MASITERMKGAALLEVATYEEVEADTTATGQAAVVVVLGAIAAGIGAARGGAGLIVGAVVWSLFQWVVWAGITYVIGDKVLGGTATWGELLRTLGFAQSPRVLAVLGIIPGMQRIVFPIIGIWVLITGVVAIRQALDFSTGKAVATALLGWLAIMVLSIPLALLGLGRL
jgi:hypothetical protein